MFEELIGKKLIVFYKDNNKSRFGTLIFEDQECLKLELKDGTVFTINKDDISDGREFKESGNYAV